MTANPLLPMPPIGPTTGMTPPPPSGGRKPVDALRMLRQHRWTLVAALLVGLGLGVGLWYALLQWAPRYESRATLAVSPTPTRATEDLGVGQSFAQTQMMEKLAKNEAVRITSDEIVRETLNRPLVAQTDWFKSFDGDLQAARNNLQRWRLSASHIRDTTLVQVSINTANPDDAPRILSELIAVYTDRLQRDLENMGFGMRKAWLDEQKRLADEIQQTEAAMDRLTASGDFEIDIANSTAKQELDSLQEQRLALASQLQAAREQHKSLAAKRESGEFAPSSADLATVEQIPEMLRMAQQDNDMQRELESATELWGPNHRQTRQKQAELEAHRRQMDAVRERKLRELGELQIEQAARAIESLSGQIAALEPQLQEARNRVKDLQDKRVQYASLQNEYERRVEEKAEVDEALRGRRVVEDRPDAVHARLYTSPTNPAELSFPRIYVIVPLMGLFVLALTATGLYLREVLDQRIKSPAEVALVTDAGLLGVVPEAGEDPSGKVDVERIVERYPTGLLAECYRQVRTTVLSRMDRRGYKTLMVVGAQPGCGTSTIVQNLGASLALNGRTVLILDANLRRPRQHALAGVDVAPGLVDALRDDATIESLIQRCDGLDLSVLPAGDTHGAPPELLESPQFRRVLGELEAQYDFILIDTAPALLTSEAQLLARQVDAIALVVAAGTDKRGMVERMLRRLDGQRGDILGVILNRVRTSMGGYFRKSYQQFYRYQTNGANGNGHAAQSSSRSAEPTEPQSS